MRIPSSLFGTGPAVAQGVRKIIRKLSAEAIATDELFGALLETNDYPDAFILVDEIRRKDAGDHFHGYAFHHASVTAFGPQGLEPWFRWSLKSPWRFIGVVHGMPEAFFSAGRESLREEFLRATLTFGRELDKLGPKFRYLGPPQLFSSCCDGAFRTLRAHGVQVGREDGAVLRSIEGYLAQQGA